MTTDMAATTRAPIRMDNRITRLGFGCSALMGRTNRAASLRLLHDAYDAGIRHFDVAPMYGYGEAEACVGEFLQDHRSTVTITTKFGLAPRQRPRFHTAKQITRRVFERLPYVERLRHQAQTSTANPIPTNLFTVANAHQALDSSLRKLRTDHIDIWLMHEANATRLSDETLLRFLEDSVQSGKVGSFGVGSERDAIPGLLDEQPNYCRVLQFEWSVFNPVLSATPQFRLHHRALTERFNARHSELVNDTERCAIWSELLNRDLRQRPQMAALMLKASLECNPDSLVLFSSSQGDHIRTNVAVSRDEGLRAPALLLHGLVQEHCGTKSLPHALI